MGILRTDRVSGLGGANAIKGSAHFHGGGDGGGIETEPSTDFQFGSSNFTIEVWANFSGFDSSGFETIVKSGNTNPSDSMFQFDYKSSESKLRIIPYVSNSSVVKQVSFTPEFDRWYHLAAVRDGNNLKIFIDGTQTGGDLSFSDTIDSETTGLSIGKRAMSDENNGFERNFNGYLSNLRIVNGTAIYTADFTPPTNELEKTSDTVLLALQSPGNLFQEATGKKLYVAADRLNQQSVTASRKTPNSPVGFSTTTDVGTQFGSTFDGVTTFDSQSYFVPPGGNTRERNRGRAVIGWANNPVNTGMDAFNIQSMGNATAFGNLTSGNRWGSHAFSSATRGLWTGGYINTPAATFFNAIEFVTIATNGNPTDFADTTSQNYRSGCCSSSTKGIIALGFIAPNFSIVNTIDQVTMATAGNATNFGDLFQTRANMASASSPTRGFFAGGVTPANQGTIDFITIASAADAQDFGDLQEAVSSPMALASSTRGIIGGGYPAPTNTNVINFITIASAGNASDFGDLIGLYSVGSAVSNKTRGVFTGGYTAPSRYNLMEFVTISTTGNASDFGDMTYGRRDFGACSDSHGGLS